MKTTGFVSIGLFFILAAIFTSCGTSVDIAKRQFNNGYYVHINTPKRSTATVLTAKQEIPVQVGNNGDLVPVHSAQAGTSVSGTEEAVSSDNSFSASRETKHPVLIRKRIKDVGIIASKEVAATIENHAHESSKHTYSSKRMDRIAGRFTLGGDAPTIVLILLCLFLPFIAVGIVDDWGTRFLISLLLTLLFWIPGVIYAFIVCFA